MHLEDYNLIYEERSILLGIINFISNNLNKYEQINIENKFYFKVIRELFPMLYVTRNYDDKYTSLNIFIKTRKIKEFGLIINNIDNVKRISCKKKYFYLLPWFNVNNPIIMFKYDPDTDEKSKSKIKKQIKKFNKIRLSKYTYENFSLTPYTCGILFWDIYVEYQITRKYSQLMNVDINVVYDLLNRHTNGFKCDKTNFVYVPVIQPYVQKEYISSLSSRNTNISNISNIDRNENLISNNQQVEFLEKFLSHVNKKISSINNVMKQNIYR
jgi:hypothetical protein